MKYTLNHPNVKRAVIAHIESIDVSKKPIFDVEIKQFRKDRSNQQNRYYWKVVLGTFSDATGYTTEELHETCKRQLLPTKIIQVGSVKKEVSTSTASLTTVEFDAYIEDIKRFVAENLGVIIPDVNQVSF